MASRRDVAMESRDRLLSMAEAVVGRLGGSGLTLDAIAREAGITKGGVLYHFGSKDALIAAMIDRLGDVFEADIAGAMDDEPAGSWTRAYARATFEPSEAHAEQIGLGGGLLAAIAEDPALLGPLRERYAGWQRRLGEDGIDPALATIVRLAADGLLMAELLGLAPPDDQLRMDVLSTLIDMTRGASS